MTQGGTWSLDEAWASARVDARTLDSSVRGTDSWIAPVAGELLRAVARESALRRWYPSFSHNSLRLAEGPPPWMPGGRDDVRDVPGFVSFAWDRTDAVAVAVFRVWSGRPFLKPDPVLVLATPVVADAVRALVGLLTDEPDQQRG
ncbi:hypothetical protein ABZ464_20250 [Streptomyces sp. NPDC005820]|uniref:hypothetical protein n=1 Tax=Streptomyces sp. NPDC005820 TaxID=3157069 RepID=UPI0033CAC333